MITILTLKDRDRTNQILQTVQGTEDNARVLMMSDGDRELGYVVVDIKSSVIRMLKMEVFDCASLADLDEQGHMYVDSLMRAAVSYGATVGAYQIESRIDELEHYFRAVGFTSAEGKLINPLSNFLKICKH